VTEWQSSLRRYFCNDWREAVTATC